MTHYVKEWRQERGLTQERLAERMPISRSYYTMIERGSRPYTQEFLEAAALELGVTPADLIAHPPGAMYEIRAMLAGATEEDRRRIESVIRAMLGAAAG